jgi:hypothetical protein
VLETLYPEVGLAQLMVTAAKALEKAKIKPAIRASFKLFKDIDPPLNK